MQCILLRCGLIMKWRLCMKTMLFAAVFVLYAVAAHADSFDKLIGYDCDPDQDAVILSYTGAYNETGRKMKVKKGPRRWDPWTLVVKDKKNKHYIRTSKTVGGECRLSDGLYRITIGPLPGNANLQGKCGGFMSAWAMVKRGDDTVLPRHEFEIGDCHMTGPVTTKITIKASDGPPAVEKVPWEDFYRSGDAQK